MPQSSPRLIGVGGGKGGVGKSIVALTIARVLSDRGDEVVLADLDLGAANLHTYLGIHGRVPTLSDFIAGGMADLSPLLVDTPMPRVHLIAGGVGSLKTANPTFQSKMKLLRHISRLSADWVVLDLGAGVHYNTLDFFNAAHYRVVVTQPEAGAVLNAYGFIKSAFLRKISRVFSKDKNLTKALEERVSTTRSRGLLTFCLTDRLSMSPILRGLMMNTGRD